MTTENPTTPLPLSSLLASRMASIRQAVASPERIAMVTEEQRRRDALRRDADMRRALLERAIPSKPETRDAVRLDTVPLTMSLETVLRALAWRQAHRRPTGETPGLLVVLAGSNGAGKTVAGCWVVARWEKTAMWLAARDLALTPDTDWSAYAEMRRKWAEVDLLMIDDVGAERGAHAERQIIERFASLVLARYEAGLATIVATNLMQGRFCARYLATDAPVSLPDGRVMSGNARLRSRLSGEQRGGGCEYWYEFDGAPDLRETSNAGLLAELPRMNAAQLAAAIHRGVMPKELLP